MIPIALCNVTGRSRLRAGASASVVILALALAVMPASSVSAATYYVDNQHPNSSAAGPGTENAPYYSISSALAVWKGPDVTIVVRPGVYREQITVPASGAPGAPFVIQAEGPGVVLEGTDSFSNEGLWVEPGPASVPGSHGLQVVDYAWLAPTVTWAAQQVFVDGRRLTRSLATPGELPVDAFTWVQGEGLYVNLGGESPGGHEILVGRRASAFRLGAKSWVTIEGFEISRMDDAGINLFVGCSDNVIARNHITLSNGYGIKLAGSLRVLIEGNIVSEGNHHGIGLTAGSADCVLRGNDSFRNAQPDMRAAKGIILAASPNNVIVGNRTFENQDTGVQLNASSHGCLLYNNRSWNNGDHGYDHLDVDGTTHVNNVASGNFKDGFSVEGNSPNTRIVNCISTDNGLTTDRFNLWVNAASAVGFTSGYNILWNSTTQEPVKFIATKYSLLSDYNTASGQDLTSLQQNPMFANASAGDFMPMAGSPAIDAGDSGVPNWPALDIVGNPRYDDPATPNAGDGPVTFADIGAIEYLPPVGEDAVQLASRLPTIGDRRAGVYGNQGNGSSGTVALSGGFPNPSRGPVDFALDLPRDSQVEWAVYDLQGRAVWSENRALAAGRSQLRWDGTALAGPPATTGIYLVRARVDGTQFTRRIIRF